jgi:hypothetical protein
VHIHHKQSRLGVDGLIYEFGLSDSRWIQNFADRPAQDAGIASRSSMDAEIRMMLLRAAHSACCATLPVNKNATRGGSSVSATVPLGGIR